MTTATNTTTEDGTAGVRRSPVARVAGVAALLGGVGLAAWAADLVRPGAAAAPPAQPVQGRKLVEYGRGASSAAAIPASQTSPASPVNNVAMGRIDFTTPMEMEKRTIKEIPVVMEGDYQRVSFSQMGSWEYRPLKFPAEGDLPAGMLGLDRFPEPIRALDGKKIAIEGFMIPVEVERDKVKSFVFVSSPLVCCFGQVPKLNEWFLVKMAGEGRAYIMMDLPITVRGRLSMGEEIKNRSVVSLYRIEADEVLGPRDF